MTIPFGKYKGKSIDWVYDNDKKYFKWLESIPLKDKFAEQFADYHLRLKEIQSKKEASAVQIAKELIKNYVSNKKRVRAVNVHSVGFEFRLGDLSLEDILNRDFTLWYTLPNGTHTHISLSKGNYDILYRILDKYWKETGEVWEDRGLY